MLAQQNETYEKAKENQPPSFTIPSNVKVQDNQLYLPKVGYVDLRRKGGNRTARGVRVDPYDP